jgi:hypothetical protein
MRLIAVEQYRLDAGCGRRPDVNVDPGEQSAAAARIGQF